MAVPGKSCGRIMSIRFLWGNWKPNKFMGRIWMMMDAHQVRAARPNLVIPPYRIRELSKLGSSHKILLLVYFLWGFDSCEICPIVCKSKPWFAAIIRKLSTAQTLCGCTLGEGLGSDNGLVFSETSLQFLVSVGISYCQPSLVFEHVNFMFGSY